MPNDDDAELIAYLKFVSVRDHLLADIPGLDEPMSDLLRGQTKSPRWARVDRVEQVLPPSTLEPTGRTSKPTRPTAWPNSRTGSLAPASSPTGP